MPGGNEIHVGQSGVRWLCQEAEWLAPGLALKIEAMLIQRVWI